MRFTDPQGRMLVPLPLHRSRGGQPQPPDRDWNVDAPSGVVQGSAQGIEIYVSISEGVYDTFERSGQCFTFFRLRCSASVLEPVRRDAYFLDLLQPRRAHFLTAEVLGDTKGEQVATPAATGARRSMGVTQPVQNSLLWTWCPSRFCSPNVPPPPAHYSLDLLMRPLYVLALRPAR